MNKLLFSSIVLGVVVVASAANARDVDVYVGGSPRYYTPPPSYVVVQEPAYVVYPGGYYRQAPDHYWKGQRHDRNWKYWYERDRRDNGKHLGWEKGKHKGWDKDD